jgi:TRAP-type C4-dicarboxylate transport system substrate-binding protein
MKLQRRQVLTAIGVSAGASIAKPAIAQSMPNIKWQLAASWPKSLDTAYGSCEMLAKRVAEITDNQFQIQVFAAGEIVPALAVLDAVQAGTVEIGAFAARAQTSSPPSLGRSLRSRLACLQGRASSGKQSRRDRACLALPASSLRRW